MVDAGHKASEKILKEIESKVEVVYKTAAEEAQDKFDNYMARFAKRDAQKLELVKAGKITQEEYAAWRQGQMLTGKRWHDLADTLARDFTNSDKIAMDIVNGYLPDVYAVNMNYGTYQVENAGTLNTSFTLYNRQTVERLIKEEPNLLPKPKVKIPKDMRWNKQHIVNAVTQGVLQGESVAKIAKRLEDVVGMDKNAAMRNARTAVTGAESAGRVAAYKRAKDMGIKGKIEWVAGHDGRTRESHLEVDGEQVEVGHLFSNGCAYPADPSGPPEEVYNCRCTTTWASAILGQVKDDPNYKASEYEKSLDAYRQDKDAHKMSFAEWEKARK